jgi:hypothetical protein
MKNQKSIEKLLGKATSELRDLPPDAQMQAVCNFQIRIKELKLEHANDYSHKYDQSTDYRTRRAL